MPPLASSAQATRAILLASAIATNGYLTGLLIVTCVAAVLAYWRRAALSRSELWIYALAIAYFVLGGFVARG